MHETTVLDRLRYLYGRDESLSANLNTVRGKIQSLENKYSALERAIEELQGQRELDRAKLASLQSQMLDIGDCQLSIVTGGLRPQPPEPEEAIAVLAKHAGRKFSSELIGKAIVTIPLLVLGGLGVFFSLPEPSSHGSPSPSEKVK